MLSKKAAESSTGGGDGDGPAEIPEPATASGKSMQ